MTPSPHKHQNGAIDATGEGGAKLFIRGLPWRATPEEGRKKYFSTMRQRTEKSVEFAILQGRRPIQSDPIQSHPITRYTAILDFNDTDIGGGSRRSS